MDIYQEYKSQCRTKVEGGREGEKRGREKVKREWREREGKDRKKNNKARCSIKTKKNPPTLIKTNIRKN